MIMKTSCGACKPVQKKKIRALLVAVKAHKPKEWKEMLALYDPSEEYRGQINKLLTPSKKMTTTSEK